MRPARALVDLDALRHNYRLARASAGHAMAIVKADAYGHGAVECARALEPEAEAFGVACIEEALALREAGIARPILLLEGFFEAEELALIERHDLWCVVASQWQLRALERFAPQRPPRIWLKMDSGMHRLGLPAHEFADAWQRLHRLPWVRDAVAMTHFANADDVDDPRTREQVATFDAACAGLDVGVRSLANSAGLLAWPDARRDWVRPGLMLYGASPFAAPNPAADALRPVMSLRSRVIAVRELEAGEPIGYGGTFVTPRPMRVGVVAMGYADGYPQRAPEGTPVAVDGHASRIVGRVSMDMLTIDLTTLPGSDVGSEVELWGPQVPLADVVRHCGVSAYSLLTGLKRVEREYVSTDSTSLR